MPNLAASTLPHLVEHLVVVVVVAAAAVVVAQIVPVPTSRELLSVRKGLKFYNFSYSANIQFLYQQTKFFSEKISYKAKYVFGLALLSS
jgi:hypothetical protein